MHMTSHHEPFKNLLSQVSLLADLAENIFLQLFFLQKNLVSYLVTGSLDEEDFEDKLLVKLENSTSRVEALRG